ncbi:MAG TPA: type II toxin-antitoxin system RelE/ParE family toxin [Firmicutes bacterium]|nr:type II toxin-antitoxin system RelE/ParE family toxin [Bacillota bacterium]
MIIIHTCFQVSWDKAVKEVQKLDPVVQARIHTKVNWVSRITPFPWRKLQNMELYKLRVGPYRILMDVDFSTRSIKIIHVGHRSKIYRG